MLQTRPPCGTAARRVSAPSPRRRRGRRSRNATCVWRQADHARRGCAGAQLGWELRFQPFASLSLAAPQRCASRTPARARASCAPVLDVQAAQRKGGVVRVVRDVRWQRRFVANGVQRLHHQPPAGAVPRDAVGRHDERRAAGDADAHRLCVSVRGAARRGVSAGCEWEQRQAPTPRRSAKTHVLACCHCPRSWGSRRSAQQAPPAAGSAKTARSAPPGASFGRRGSPAGGCDAPAAAQRCCARAAARAVSEGPAVSRRGKRRAVYRL